MSYRIHGAFVHDYLFHFDARGCSVMKQFINFEESKKNEIQRKSIGY